MTPKLRKIVLTTHVTVSVAWLGGVVTFLALAIAALVSPDASFVRATYRVLEPIGWTVLVPLSIASFATGVAQSLGTRWGLFRHYWVIAKLAINVVATVILLLYMQTLAAFTTIAANPKLTDTQILGVRSPSPVIHAGGAAMLLLVAIILSVFKPRGLTPYGQRKASDARTETNSPPPLT